MTENTGSMNMNISTYTGSTYIRLFLDTVTIHFYIYTEVIFIGNGCGQNHWSYLSKNIAPYDK